MSQFFASGGQSIRASASASVLPVNIQELKPRRALVAISRASEAWVLASWGVPSLGLPTLKWGGGSRRQDLSGGDLRRVHPSRGALGVSGGVDLFIFVSTLKDHLGVRYRTVHEYIILKYVITY